MPSRVPAVRYTGAHRWGIQVTCAIAPASTGQGKLVLLADGSKFLLILYWLLNYPIWHIQLHVF